jgi:hypothetical protein
MMSASRWPYLGGLLVFILLAVWSVANAQVVRLGSVLIGSEAVPPTTSQAQGQGEFEFDATTNQLTFTIVFGGLSGPAVAADIHGPAAPGANANIVVAFPVPQSPISGTIRLSDAEASALLAGSLYVDVHTSANPQGEIRGQIKN